MKRIIWLFVAIVIVVALWSGTWLFVAGEVRDKVLLLADADGVTTPRLTCGRLNVSGFPFRFDLDCPSAEVTSGDLVVRAMGLRASVLVYRPTHVLASLQGPVEIEDSFTGSQSTLNFVTLEASARTDGWKLARVSVRGTDLDWSDTLLGNTPIAKGSLLALQLGDIAEQHDAQKGLAALALYVQAKDLVAQGLGITDGNGEIEIEVSGVPDDVRAFGEPAALINWRAAGGQLKLVSAHASDAESDLKATGTLALNPQGLLEGRIDITSTKVVERIETLLLEPYRTLVLGNPAPDGSYVNRLNFRAGTIYAGLVPIGAVPPLF